VRASSYGSGTVSSGKVMLDAAVSGVVDVKGRHVLLVSGGDGRAC
jgi:hypoxanthine-guanine phosphoribosyltransferase